MNVLWLDDPAARDVAVVGGKVANLARLAGSFRVPPGFGISCDAMPEFAPGRTQSGGVPPDLSRVVEEAYRHLSERCGVSEASVAVRSSAVEEDGAAASFAGQFDTFLNVSGAAEVLAAVARCWDSVKGARALRYAARQGGAAASQRIGVLVQQFVPADVSAVVFSANPVTGDRDQVLINANFGLGESVVSGLATPDTVVVRKADLTVLAREVGAKERMSVPVPGGTREVTVPADRQACLALTDSQAGEMARLAIDLEWFFGWPADVECAYLGAELFVLQCRPITALTP